MKEFNITWADFHQRYLKTETVFVEEYDDRWDFYVSIGHFVIKSTYPKGDYSKNAIFVLTYLYNQNIIKVILPEPEIYIEPDQESEEDLSNGTDTELQDSESY